MANQFPPFDHEAILLNPCVNAAMSLSSSLSNRCNEDPRIVEMLEEIMAYSKMLWTFDRTYDVGILMANFDDIFTLKRRLISSSREALGLAFRILFTEAQINQINLAYILEFSCATKLIIDGFGVSSLRSEFKRLVVDNMTFKLVNVLQCGLSRFYTPEINSLLRSSVLKLEEEITTLKMEVDELSRKLYQLADKGPDHVFLVRRYQQILDQKDLILDDISRLAP